MMMLNGGQLCGTTRLPADDHGTAATACGVQHRERECGHRSYIFISFNFGGTRAAFGVYGTEQSRRVESFFLTDEWLLWVRLTLNPACFVSCNARLRRTPYVSSSISCG